MVSRETPDRFKTQSSLSLTKLHVFYFKSRDLWKVAFGSQVSQKVNLTDKEKSQKVTLSQYLEDKHDKV